MTEIVGVHPAAELFPEMTGSDYSDLVQDINDNGLRVPILVTPDGLILDGRNRYKACNDCGVEPKFLVREIADPWALVISFNLHRRHLNASQRAMIAAKVAKRSVGNPNVVLSTTLMSESQAADQLSVSKSMVTKAKRVAREATDEVKKKVEAGEMSIPEAVATLPEKIKITSKASSSTTFLQLKTHDGNLVMYQAPKSKSTFVDQGDDPGIDWAKWSWNPVTGCLHGCDYCYARDIATSSRTAAAFPAGFTPLRRHDRLDAPLNTKFPENEVLLDPRKGRVFVCSMADLYGRWVPREWIEEVHEACIAAPQWEYLFLTKFPDYYVELISKGVPLTPNSWLGTSVDSQKRVHIAERAFSELKEADIKVKWLSLEPLLEPVKFNDMSMFDWVVIGAQTRTTQPAEGKITPGNHDAFAPPFEWVADLVVQARESGCRIYLKPNLFPRNPQYDGKHPGMQIPQEAPF